MLLLRSVVIPFITQYMNVERKNNNICRTVIRFFFSRARTNHSRVVVEFASRILPGKKKKSIYLRSTNDRHRLILYVPLVGKDRRISTTFISLVFFYRECKKLEGRLFVRTKKSVCTKNRRKSCCFSHWSLYKSHYCIIWIIYTCLF
jgi:hypothetical protein